MKVLIVDDHLMFAEALALALQAKLPGCEVGQYGCAQALLGDEAALVAADLLIVDVAMPDLDGLSLLRILASSRHTLRVLLCSGAIDEDVVEKSQRLAVDGFVDKSEAAAELVTAVTKVMAGEGYFSESYRLLASQTTAPSIKLSRQQGAILALLQQGQSNKEIARSLSVSLNTVKTHLRLLFDKLDVPNRTACLEKARSLKLL